MSIEAFDHKHLDFKVFTMSPEHAPKMSIESTELVPEKHVHLQSTTGQQNQQWTLIPLQNGSVAFKVLHSQMFLNFAGKDSDLLAGHFSQMSEWHLLPQHDGSFIIKFAYQEFVIDVSGASKSNGAKIITWTVNNKENQKFRFNIVANAQPQSIQVMEPKHNEHMHSHIYMMTPEHAPDMAVDLSHPEPNSHVHLWAIHRRVNQQWKIIPFENGTVGFQNMQTGFFMNAHGKGKYVDAGMHSRESEWNMVRFPEGAIMIESFHDKLVLDCSGAGKINGTKIELWAVNDNKNQRFMFTEIM